MCIKSVCALLICIQLSCSLAAQLNISGGLVAYVPFIESTGYDESEIHIANVIKEGVALRLQYEFSPRSSIMLRYGNQQHYYTFYVYSLRGDGSRRRTRSGANGRGNVKDHYELLYSRRLAQQNAVTLSGQIGLGYWRSFTAPGRPWNWIFHTGSTIIEDESIRSFADQQYFTASAGLNADVYLGSNWDLMLELYYVHNLLNRPIVRHDVFARDQETGEVTSGQAFARGRELRFTLGVTRKLSLKDGNSTDRNQAYTELKSSREPRARKEVSDIGKSEWIAGMIAQSSFNRLQDYLTVQMQNRISTRLLISGGLGLDTRINSYYRYSIGQTTILPVFYAEASYYYNYEKRKQKDKLLRGNTGNAFALRIQYNPEWRIITDLESDVGLEAKQLNFIPYYSMRREYGRRFFLEGRAGWGLSYNHGVDKPGFPEDAVNNWRSYPYIGLQVGFKL